MSHHVIQKLKLPLKAAEGLVAGLQVRKIQAKARPLYFEGCFQIYLQPSTLEKGNT